MSTIQPYKCIFMPKFEQTVTVNCIPRILSGRKIYPLMSQADVPSFPDAQRTLLASVADVQRFSYPNAQGRGN